MTRTFRLLVAAVATALGLVLLAPVAHATQGFCGLTWGSLAKSGSDPAFDPGHGTLRDVRAGQHLCYDRLVIDLADARGFDGYKVQYGAVVQGGSGRQVPVRGTDLRIVLGTHAYDEDGPTYQPARPSELVDVRGHRTFRQVAWAGSFEGQTVIGLGVRARLPFRVTVLPGAPGHPNGARVVIDVAHAW